MAKVKDLVMVIVQRMVMAKDLVMERVKGKEMEKVKDLMMERVKGKGKGKEMEKVKDLMMEREKIVSNTTPLMIL